MKVNFVSISARRLFGMRALQSVCAVSMAILVCGCANQNQPPVRAPISVPDVSLSHLEAPACGARIFVVMGVNHQFPTVENLRIPQGHLYLNGALVDTVSSSPEISVLDVPAGNVELSWMPALFGEFDRGRTQQNRLTISLADHQVVFVTLEFFNDTSQSAGFFGPLGIAAGHSVRTEAVETTNKASFIGKRIVFHRTSTTRCAVENQPSPTGSEGLAASHAGPATQINRAYPMYVVNAPVGAPAFISRNAETTPLHTFPTKSNLNVVEVSSDGRWLTVLVPDGRTAYVPVSVVKVVAHK